MRLEANYKTFRFFAIIWMSIIFWLSSKPHLPTLSLFWFQDKLVHIAVFFILGFLFIKSMRAHQGNHLIGRILLITIMVGAYGVTDEVHQFFVPGREASFGDLIADTFGGFMAAIIFSRK